MKSFGVKIYFVNLCESINKGPVPKPAFLTATYQTDCIATHTECIIALNHTVILKWNLTLKSQMISKTPWTIRKYNQQFVFSLIVSMNNAFITLIKYFF